MAALAARGHTVRIETNPSGRDVDNLPTTRPPLWPHTSTMPVGSSRRKLLLDLLLAPTALAATLRFPGGNPHIIHAYLHEGALLGAGLARTLRLLHPSQTIPVVFDFQGSLVAEMVDHGFVSRRSLVLSGWRRLERWIDQQPQAILASSQHAEALLVRSFGVPASRVHTLHDSVDPATFRPRAELPAGDLANLRLRLKLPPNRPVVVYLGLLAPYQGTDLLLQAFAQLEHASPRPFGLIMGFPDVDQYRARAATLGLAGHVCLSGAVPYEQAPYYLALGDVAVAPKVSATEGSGKLLTYMAAGLPVVAFDTPVHREYLGDLGLYAPSGDASRLAAVLAEAVVNPECTNLGAALRRRIVECFTWEHAAAQIEAVYAETLTARTD
jgi:glycosyltransferase involved in cell wall biosynthesis